MDNWGIKKGGTPKLLFGGMIKQLLAAVLILFLCIGILSFEGVGARKFYSQMAYYLNSEDGDWGPAIETMVATGLWMDSINKGAFQVSAPMDNNFHLTLPVSGKIIREFGWIEVPGQGDKLFHSGIDIETEQGIPVRAALDGQVTKVELVQSLGRTVEIAYNNDVIVVYANCSEVLVKEGDIITQDQIIAKTGQSVSGHGQLHFEIRVGGQPIDPLESLEVN